MCRGSGCWGWGLLSSALQAGWYRAEVTFRDGYLTQYQKNQFLRHFKSFRLDICYHNQFTGIFSIDENLLGKFEIGGKLFSITNAKLHNKTVVLERKVLGSKTITVMVADLTTMFEALRMRVEEVETIQPIEAYKWENPEDVKGELFIGESHIVKFSETEGITVSSFWHK